MKFSNELWHRQVHFWHILYPRKIGMIFTLDKLHGYEVVQCYKTTHFGVFEIVRKWTQEDIFSISLTLIALLTSILTLKVSFWFWIMKKNWVFFWFGSVLVNPSSKLRLRNDSNYNTIINLHNRRQAHYRSVDDSIGPGPVPMAPNDSNRLPIAKMVPRAQSATPLDWTISN